MIGSILRNSASLAIALIVLFFIFWLLKRLPVVGGAAATVEHFTQPH